MSRSTYNKLFFILSIFFSASSHAISECVSWENFYSSAGCYVEAKEHYATTGTVRIKIFSSSANSSPDPAKIIHVVGPYQQADQYGSREADIVSSLNALREQHGLDIAYYDFSAINSYALQDKSYALIAALHKIDQLRASTRASMMIGISLGGVVARHALTTMESRGYKHGVTHYISYDSPHLGAHIPVSMQRLLEFLPDSVQAAKNDNHGYFERSFIEILKTYSKLVDSKHIKYYDEFYDNVQADKEDLRRTEKDVGLASDMLYKQVNSTAARQLLLQSIFANNERATDAELLIANLRAMGFPKNGGLQTKNIAIANGAISGNPLKPNSDMYFNFASTKRPNSKLTLELYITKPLADLSRDQWIGNWEGRFRPEHITWNQIVFYGQLIYPDGSQRYGDNEDTFSRTSTVPISTPSGATDTMQCSTIQLPLAVESSLKNSLSENYTPMDGKDFKALTPESCFVPTVSALAIENISMSTAASNLAELSPFDIVFASDINANHNVIDIESNLLKQQGGLYGESLSTEFKKYITESYVENHNWGFDNKEGKVLNFSYEWLIPIMNSVLLN
jgi:PGAP1-like protein